MNAGRDVVGGLRCFPSLAASAGACPTKRSSRCRRNPWSPVVRDCLAARVPAAVVWAGGFAETDAEGRARQRELEDGLPRHGPQAVRAELHRRHQHRHRPDGVVQLADERGRSVHPGRRVDGEPERRHRGDDPCPGAGARASASGSPSAAGTRQCSASPTSCARWSTTRARASSPSTPKGLSDPAGFVEALAAARRAREARGGAEGRRDRDERPRRAGAHRPARRPRSNLRRHPPGVRRHPRVLLGGDARRVPPARLAAPGAAAAPATASC